MTVLVSLFRTEKGEERKGKKEYYILENRKGERKRRKKERKKERAHIPLLQFPVSLPSYRESAVPNLYNLITNMFHPCSAMSLPGFGNLYLVG